MIWFSEELSVSAADLYSRCSYLKKRIGCKFSTNIFSIKRMIHVHFWMRISLLQLKCLFERCITCYEHSMVKFVSTRDHLIPLICVYIPERVSAYEGCTLANFLHYILCRDWDEGFVSNGSEDILHDNKIYSCTMELPSKSASLVVNFVLFCFVFICDESVTLSFNQKYRKSFYSYDKNKLFSYDIIRGIQQATNHFFFFFFFGTQRGNQ